MERPPDELDTEDVRRWRNKRRRRARRRNRRLKWLAKVRELEPETADALEAIRQHNPQGYRKGLVAAARRLGFYEFTTRHTTRDLPPMDQRRAEDTE